MALPFVLKYETTANPRDKMNNKCSSISNSSTEVFVWWFCGDDLILRYGDGRKAIVGETHCVDPSKIELAKFGLHGSIDALDAVCNASGKHLFYCRLEGSVIHGEDKSVASQRTYLAGGIDVSDVLRNFAKRYALDMVHFWDAPQIAIDYLNSDTEELREEVMLAIIETCKIKMYHYASPAANAANMAASTTAKKALVAAKAAADDAKRNGKKEEYNQILETMFKASIG